MRCKKVGELLSKAKIEKCGAADYPVLSMTMHDGIVFQQDRFKKQIASVDQSTYNVVRRNQLVVSFPIDEGVLAIQDITDAGIVSPAYKIWNVDQTQVIPKYLELFLRSPYSIQYYKAKLRGSTARRRSITDDDLLGMEICLGEKKEQAHILSVLGHIKTILDLRKQELLKLDDLIKARFVEEIQPLLDTGKTVPLDYLVEDDRPITYGILKPGSGFPGGIPVIKVKDMRDGVIDQSDLLLTTPELDYQYRRSRLRAGDLLISIRGSVGRMAEVPENLENANITQDTARLTIKPEYNRVYVRGVLESQPLQHDMEKNIRGVAVKGINIGYLRELGIPMCDRKTQDRLAALYQQCDKSKLIIQRSLDETQILFDSLMQEYFGKD